MTDWNPDAPETAGLQWPASRELNHGLGYNLGRAALIDVGTTQTYNTIKAFFDTRVPQLVVGGGAMYGLDVYDPDDMNPGTIRTAYALPTADRSHTTGWVRNDTGLDANLWANLDDQPPNLSTDTVRLDWTPANGGSGDLIVKVSTSWRDLTTGGVVSLSGQRILRVIVTCYVINFAPETAVFVTGLLDYNVSGGPYPIGNGIHLPFTSSSAVQFMAWGSGTGLQHRGHQGFRPSDLDVLEDTGAGGIGIRVQRAGGFATTTSGIHVYNLAARVEYVDEKRLATAWTEQPVGQAWVPFALASPLTGVATSLTKTAGDRLLVVARTNNITGTGNTWRALDAGNTEGHTLDRLGSFAGLDIPFEFPGNYQGAGLPALSFTVPATDATPDARAPAMYLLQTGTVRADGQPYAQAIHTELPALALFGQRFTVAATAEYGNLQFLVNNSAAAHAAGAVQIGLFRDSDDAQMGTYSEWDPAVELPPANDRWMFADARVGSAPTLTSGVRYYVQFIGSAGAVKFMQLRATTTEAGAAGFGGTANNAFDPESGGAGRADADYAGILVAQVPVPLSGLSIGVEWYATDRGLTGTSCIVEAVPFARLMWDVTAYGAGFATYEVERRETVGTWTRVAELTIEEFASFSDLEVLRGIGVPYRARVRLTSGSVSDWATFGFGINVPHTDPWVVTLASNEYPRGTLGVYDEPGYEWTPVAPENDVEKRLYGRDRMLVFREHEQRGDRFRRELIAGFNDPTHEPGAVLSGRAVFDAFVALLHNPEIPYVAMLDGRGRRWFTSAAIGAMREDEPQRRYAVPVQFTEVAGPTPAIVSTYDMASTALPDDSLAVWISDDTPQKNIVAIGDGVVGRGGGTVGFPAALRALLGRNLQNGGLGYQPLYQPEWGQAGTWAHATTANVWDKAPFLGAWTSISGTSAEWTWTKPAGETVANFDLCWIDGASGGDWSYSVNGGAWTAMAATRTFDNALKIRHVATAVTSTVRVRAATSAGVAARIYFAGLIAHSASTGGFMMHNLGYEPGKLSTFNRATAGDPLEFFDVVNATLVILSFADDVDDANTIGAAQFGANLDTLIGDIRAKGGTDILGVLPPEQGSRNPITQRAFRRAARDALLANGCGYIDVGELWGAYDAGNGFMASVLYPNDVKGHADIARRIYELLHEVGL